MPNWCDNRLRLIGDSGVIDQFIEGIHKSEQESMLHAYIPFPPGLAATIEMADGKHMGIISERAYDWCLKNWGCKWGDSGLIFGTNDYGVIEIYFTTPWGPPEAGIANLSTIFPELTFTLAYHEDGMGFAGGCNFHEGIQINAVDRSDLLPQWEDDEEEKWIEEIEKMYEHIFETI
jgi:hypothetical protein